MNKHPDQSGTLEAALGYAGKGLPIFPVCGKVPAVRGWQQFVADEVKLRVFCGRGCGVALRTGESGYVVVDTDTDSAEQWPAENIGTPDNVLIPQVKIYCHQCKNYERIWFMSNNTIEVLYERS